MVEFIGWVGSILLAFCALPQVLDSYRKGSSDGVTWGLLLMWGLGEIFTLIYIIPKNEPPLAINYLLNIFFILIILYYKVYPNKGE